MSQPDIRQADEYVASPLEQLLPSRLSRLLLMTLVPSATGAFAFVVNWGQRLSPSLTTFEQNLLAVIAALVVLLVFSCIMLVDLALLFQAKRHRKVIYHLAKGRS